MMQCITIRIDYAEAASAEDTLVVELKPSENIIMIGPYDGSGYEVFIAGPREDIAPEGTSA